MKNLLNKNGMTIVEIIISLAVLGIVICPLMSMFITSEMINIESNKEYRSIQQAQNYMEEIRALDRLDIETYPFNSESGLYERTIFETNDVYGADIKIKPDVNNILYYIVITIKCNEEIINELEGTVLFK